MLSIRCSMLNTYADCPLKGVLTFRAPPVASDAQERGTRVHARLLGDTETATAYINKVVPGAKVIAVETPLTFNFGLFTLTGTADCIFLLDGVPVLGDLKTTAANPDETRWQGYIQQPQTLLYSWLYNNDNRLRVKARGIILQKVVGPKETLGSVYWGSVPYLDAQGLQATDLVYSFARDLLAPTLPVGTPGQYCHWCSWKETCNYAR